MNHRLSRTCGLIACVAFMTSCAQPSVRTTSSVHSAQSNTLLRELAREDQASRKGDSITRTDADRIKLVLAEIANGSVRTPEDKTNAALVLQHTGFTFCNNKLTAISPDNYLLAHELAKSAFEAGYADARYLVPQTIDRYLSMTEGRQKYGTSRINNQQTGAEEYPPIDRNTTDAERAKYGVRPLAELLKQYPEQAPKSLLRTEPSFSGASSVPGKTFQPDTETPKTAERRIIVFSG